MMRPNIRRLDKAKRLAYFDEAAHYTPYVATQAGDALFLVKTEDKHIARSLFGKQSRGELAVLGRAAAAVRGLFGDAHVAERMFVDVGANIGTTSIPAVLSEGFASAVAIEPEPENVRVLRLNVLLNDLDDRITVLPVAVSDAVGESELVVTPDRAGKHWLAANQTTRERKRSGRERETLTVKTITVDRLAETGEIDVDRTGLMWIDAEAHEGHILAGATALLERGTPLVLEWNPSNLDKVGDRGRLQDAVAEHYTHFAGMHRNPNPNQPSFPLQTADCLPAYAERFLNPDNFLNKTDILVLRLTDEQAASVRSVDEFIRFTRAYEADDSSAEQHQPADRPPLLRRLLGRE
jgi:FkbM family methyltransferase